jgi:calmodulin-binding transcription activator
MFGKIGLILSFKFILLGKMVASLLSSRANPSLVADTTHDVLGGQTASDLVAWQGYHGLATYLCEKGLTAHSKAMSLSKDKRPTSRIESSKQNTKEFDKHSEQDLFLWVALIAYRSDAGATNIQATLMELLATYKILTTILYVGWNDQ